MPKLVGIDYGSKRVGIAVSDETGSIAFPRTSLANDSALIPTIVTLVRQENASTVVVGESKGPLGDNAIMKDIRAFVAELEKRVAVKILYEPEFYTSVEARMEGKAGPVDAEAASIILNSYIQRTKPQ